MTQTVGRKRYVLACCCVLIRRGTRILLTLLPLLQLLPACRVDGREIDPARIPEIRALVADEYPDRNPFRKPENLPKLVLCHRNPWFPMDRECMLDTCGADRPLLQPTGDPVKDLVAELTCAKRYGIDVIASEQGLAARDGHLSVLASLLEAAEKVQDIAVCSFLGNITTGGYEALKEELILIFEEYAKHPNYLKVDGKPVFLIYRPTNYTAQEWKKLLDELGRLGHTGVFLGNVCYQPTTPEETVLSYLQVFAGSFRYGQSPRGVWQKIYGFMTPLMKGVFPHKLYAADLQASHIQGWNFHESAPDFTLNELWPRMLGHDPDWIQLTNWNDTVEHSCFIPTRQNSDGLLTLSQYYIRKWKGQPTLRTDKPRLFVLSREEALLAEDLRLDFYAFPAKDPGPYAVTCELLNERLEPIMTLTAMRLKLDDLRAETHVVPAANLMTSRCVVPRVTVENASGETVYDGRLLRYIPVRADKRSMLFYAWNDVSQVPDIEGFDLKVGGVGYRDPGAKAENQTVTLTLEAPTTVRELRLYRNWREVHCWNECKFGPVPEGCKRSKVAITTRDRLPREGRLSLDGGRIEGAYVRRWDKFGDIRITERTERAVSWSKEAGPGNGRHVVVTCLTEPDVPIRLTYGGTEVTTTLGTLEWEAVYGSFADGEGGFVVRYITPEQQNPFPIEPLGRTDVRLAEEIPLKETGRRKDYYHVEALMENGSRFTSPPVYVRTTEEDRLVPHSIVVRDEPSGAPKAVRVTIRESDVCRSFWDFESPVRRVGVDEGGYNFHAVYGGGANYGTGIVYEDREYGFGGPATGARPEGFPQILEEDGNRFARFDGVDDFAVLPTGAGQPGAYTVKLRIRPRNVAGGQGVLSLRFHLWLSITPDGRVKAQRSAANGYDILVGKHVLTPARWTRVAVTFDLETMRLYLDGELCGETEVKQPVAVNAHYTYAYIGATVVGYKRFSEGSFFHGDLDEVEVIGRALSAEEIRGEE